MPPTVLQLATPASASTPFPNRPVRGITLHHTATPHGSLPLSKRGASWQVKFGSDGTIYLEVPRERAAHTTGATDRWRPPWVVPCPGGAVSDCNYSSEGWEIVYAPQNGEVPTDAQYASIRWLAEQRYAQYGPQPFIGHGEVDLSKWLTEPHGFDWQRAGFGQRGVQGRFWTPSQEEYPVNATDDEIKAYMEQFGFGANMATAIMQRAALAYRRDENPGPLMSDEYPATSPEGDNVIRQNFSARVCQYNLATGGVGWVEVVKELGGYPPI